MSRENFDRITLALERGELSYMEIVEYINNGWGQYFTMDNEIENQID